MLVGQQLGPFLIEKELGAGAMGAVYRGKYLETGQLVAVKIMAPGLGTSSNAAAARFEREAKILKQLKHPNIVRLFGVGKHQGTAYYAMEYVQGESLDRVMARRDRMTWEEVVELGQQLCAALQHAHEKGIVHRDLKPSNLMILNDGTLKLTDFGIAKDLDVTQLTGANCTIGTASYMSPEQCRGEHDLSFKSDLYSLGVVFYELITGRKPFNADNAMEMFLLHVNGTFERPSRIVLDLPVWLDTLICQLLEKKPDQRPFDAAMVSQVLGSIQEKVAAQQSAGVDVARARLMDRPRGQRNPDETEREVVRTLLGKPRAKKKKKKALHQMVWLQALGILILLSGVVAVLAIVLQPPSADKLYRQAEKLMSSPNPDNHDRAYDGPIKEYLQRYGALTNEQSEKVHEWADNYDVARYEKLLARHMNWVKKGGLAVGGDDAEKVAFKAAEAEDAGDADKAKALWNKAREAAPTRLGAPARRHLQMLDGIDAKQKELLALRRGIRMDRKEPKLDNLARQAFLGLRHEQFGDLEGARRRFEQMKEAADKEEGQRFWRLFATVKQKQMADALKKKPQDKKARVELVRNVLADARSQFPRLMLEPRAAAHEVEMLYENEEDMAERVKEAKALVKQIDAKLPPLSPK